MQSYESHHPDKHSLEQSQRESAELERAQAILANWLQESSLPQIQALRRNPEPRILVVGGQDATVGPQIAETIQAQALLEQTPHGQQLSETELKDDQAVQAAFVEPAQIIVLPFTFDHIRSTRGMDFAFIAATDLKAVMCELLAHMQDDTIVLVTTNGQQHKPLFELLGLQIVKDDTLAEPQNIPEDAAQLMAYVRGETIFDDKTTELIRSCDCMIANIVNTLAMSSSILETCIDELGIHGDQLDEFQNNLSHFKQAALRLPERLIRMKSALPELSQHPNAEVRALAELFAVSAKEFSGLITIVNQIDQAAATLTEVYHTQTIDADAKAAIKVIENSSAQVLGWYEAFKPMVKPVGKNNVYKAYRIITPESARQEFPKS